MLIIYLQCQAVYSLTKENSLFESYFLSLSLPTTLCIYIYICKIYEIYINVYVVQLLNN